MQYRLFPSPNVSARSFGDEVVAANFVRGVYYSMLGSAAQIWEGLLGGVSLDQVMAAVGPLTEADEGAFKAAVIDFVENLLAEGLLVPAEALEQTPWTPTPAPEGKYALPQLERFTDMEDLLLLDPVHDVEEMGWPHADPLQNG